MHCIAVNGCISINKRLVVSCCIAQWCSGVLETCSSSIFQQLCFHDSSIEQAQIAACWTFFFIIRHNLGHQICFFYFYNHIISWCYNQNTLYCMSQRIVFFVCVLALRLIALVIDSVSEGRRLGSLWIHGPVWRSADA